MIQPLL